MPCQIRQPELVEDPPYQNLPRIKRLQNLVCIGPWSGDNEIVLILWVTDGTKTGGGYWVAWEDPNPGVNAP